MFGPDYGSTLHRLEAKLDLILGHLGIEVEEPHWVAQARQLIADGKTIQAIRTAREATGMGLKEAKELVDSMASGRVRIVL